LVRHRRKVLSDNFGHEQLQLQTLQKSRPVSFAARTELREWLLDARLGRHELHFLDVCGPDMAPSDLSLLDESDVEALATEMTAVETKRFTLLLGQLRSIDGGGGDE
jgi:hypothetical protein